MSEEQTPWTVDDPRMWREQCRVGDVAFQHLFVTTRGMPVPDWVKEGLPKMYHLLSELQRAQKEYAELKASCEGLIAAVNVQREKQKDSAVVQLGQSDTLGALAVMAAVVMPNDQALRPANENKA